MTPPLPDSPASTQSIWKPAVYGLAWAATLAVAYHYGQFKALKSSGATHPNSELSTLTSATSALSKKSPSLPVHPASDAVDEHRLTMEGDTLAELNPQEDFDALMTQPATPARNRALVRLFAKWAELDGPTALAKALSLNEPLLRSEARDSALRHWSITDPESAWKFAKTDNGLTLPDDRFSLIVQGLAQGTPESAFSFFEKHPDVISSVGSAITAFDTLYQRGNQEKLISWTEKLPPGPLRDAAANRVIDQWARYSPEQAKAWMDRIVANNPKNTVPARIELAESWARVNPQQALQWVSSLPSKEQDASYYDRIFSRWLQLDRDAAATKLATMPALPALDRSIERYSNEIVNRDPAGTMPWAESIQDEGRRWRAIQRVANVWKKKDPTSFTSYVQGAGYSAEQMSQLLKP